MSGVAPRTMVLLALGVVVVAVAASSSFMGIDFGVHWDEDKTLGSVARAHETGRPLPGWYMYPSVCFGTALAASLPELLTPGVEAESHFLSDHFKFRVRTLYALLSLLALPAVFLLVRACGWSLGEGILAMAILAGSWEWLYKTRWIATDCLMASAAMFCLLFCIRALRSQERWRRDLLWASVFAAVAAGTKYPAAVFALPVGVTAMLRFPWKSETPLRSVVLLAGLGGIFLLTFVCSTPGILFEPMQFIHDVTFEIHHYAQGHGVHTISPGPKHLVRLLDYLFCSSLSGVVACSIIFGILSIAGVFHLFFRDWRLAVVVLSAPAVYMTYLSIQRVMTVQNYTVLIPIVAVLAAHGAVSVVEHVRWRAARGAVWAVVAAAIVVSLGWQVHAANTVRMRSDIDHGANVRRYLKRHKGDSFFLTEEVCGLLSEKTNRTPMSNLVDDPSAADFVLVSSAEVPWRRRWQEWETNKRGLYELVSGSLEVDFNYYSCWAGDSKIVAVEASRLDESRISIQ